MKSHNLYECFKMLEKAVEVGHIRRDPNNHDNVIIWFNESENYVEGWYSMNIFLAASDLSMDEEGQLALLFAIRQKDPEYNPPAMLPPCRMEDIP